MGTHIQHRNYVIITHGQESREISKRTEMSVIGGGGPGPLQEPVYGPSDDE